MKSFLFMVLCFLQLGAPLLAQRIKERFQQLGTTMSSRPAAMFNISNFWSEARKLQRTTNDSVVRQLLLVYYGWWVAALVVFFSIVVVGFPDP
jgi:hypothetical protein